MISPYGRPQTFIVGIGGLIAVAAAAAFQLWITAVILALVALAGLAFFRDPERKIPTLRGQVVAPADGRISSIHDIEHFEPFNGPAKCIRIFLSVLDVHVNRSPLHGRVASITHKPGQYLNALKAESAELNESVTIVMINPAHQVPIAAVRQIAGAIARRIVTGCEVGDTLQRGQRFGLIKFGSTTEVYLPYPEKVEVRVRKGQYVWGGQTVLAMVSSLREIGEETQSPA